MTRFLLAQFNILADASGGVQRLRELILQLAVTGKLGTGDEGDEKAEMEFLNNKLLDTQKKKPTSFSNNCELEWEDHSLPKNWIIEKLGNISDIVRGVSFPKNDVILEERIDYSAVLRSNNVGRSLNLNSLIYIPDSYISNQHRIKTNDFIVAMSSGSRNLVGKVSLIRNPITGCVGAFCGIIRLFTKIDVEYLNIYFQNPIYRKKIASFGKGIGINNLSKVSLENLPIPIPPIGEQQRIVKKVNNLMALCDDLEAKQTQKHAHLVKLGTGSLTALQQSTTQEELIRWWGHLQNNFGLIFDCVENVAALRQAILQLAVTGRLGTGDERDEDASEYGYSKINGFEMGFPRLPEKWVYSVFSEIGTVKSNLVDPKDYFDYPHIAPNNIEKGTGKLLYYATIREDGIFSPNHLFSKGQLLYSKIRPNLSKLIIAEFEGLCSADMYPITTKIDIHYLKVFMLSELFLQQVTSDDNRVAMPKINKTQLYGTVIAIPPRAEQKRIIKKIDQLLYLCDELEKRFEKRASAPISLSKSIITQVITNNVH